MSLRKSINEMCSQCIYDKHQEGGKLQQIAKCTGKACPLFTVRPLPKQVISAASK